MLEECLRIKFDLARRRGKAARGALRIHVGMLGMTGLQDHAYAAKGGAQLLQGDAGRGELMPVGGVDVAIPELLGEAEPDGKIENDFSIGARFAGRRATAGRSWTSDCASSLISKPIFSPSRSKAEATGSTMSAISAVGFINRSAWA